MLCWILWMNRQTVQKMMQEGMMVQKNWWERRVVGSDGEFYSAGEQADRSSLEATLEEIEVDAGPPGMDGLQEGWRLWWGKRVTFSDAAEGSPV